jgi:hypothetical protein
MPLLTIHVFAVHQRSHLVDDLRAWRYLISAIPIAAAVSFIPCPNSLRVDAPYLVKGLSEERTKQLWLYQHLSLRRVVTVESLGKITCRARRDR